MKTKLLIFGISGDLSRRKLLPALGSIITAGEMDDLEIIGVSRRDLVPSELFEDVLLGCSSLFMMDMAREDEYVRLKTHLNLSPEEQLIIYLSVPPAASHQIVSLLGVAGLNTPNVKLLLEKPFGVDLVSAEDMLDHIARYYSEEQVYRIDHYLAKEMAQNIVAFRAGNALFDYVWDSHAIESIEVVASETIGIEGRAQFYEQTGALRDVVQGHLMQLLALVLMDVPGELDWNVVPELRLAALRHIQAVGPAKARRAQYEGYQEEAQNLGSTVETFVSVELVSRDPRWRGVGLTLTTGKALAEKSTEIRINFKKSHESQRNRLIFRIQPNEGVEIDLVSKKPGYDRTLIARPLAFSYPEDEHLPDAYEQVLVDAIRSEKSLFTSGPEVRESWRILQPLLSSWEMSSEALPVYPRGADSLLI